MGRSSQESAIFLVAQLDALDQYFFNHPQKFFARLLEATVLGPDNPHTVGPRLVCTTAEESLKPDEGFFNLARHAAPRGQGRAFARCPGRETHHGSQESPTPGGPARDRPKIRHRGAGG
ncbi:hypothetical protein DFAR_2500011 [Desulfarculales bacterium]